MVDRRKAELFEVLLKEKEYTHSEYLSGGTAV